MGDDEQAIQDEDATPKTDHVGKLMLALIIGFIVAFVRQHIGH